MDIIICKIIFDLTLHNQCPGDLTNTSTFHSLHQKYAETRKALPGTTKHVNSHKLHSIKLIAPVVDSPS